MTADTQAGTSSNHELIERLKAEIAATPDRGARLGDPLY